ncbi:precursor of CEP13-like [Chenopodium quinoa]|uniref:Uncharacterized protein n=1 Tax=Chenopodium quinoa TaxID=63459 RepID=A0A803LVU1_CHEQI|nr:precursor of CEP13-like [Chenopodium quinoa]
MARATAIILAFVLVGLTMFTPHIEAARMMFKETKKIPHFEASLLTNALPKGTILHSAPSDKGDDEVVLSNMKKLFMTMYRTSNRDRVLQSVPSPGVGHH